MTIYIQAAQQISIQQPLCEEWFDNPILHDKVYVRAIDPNFKEMLDAGTARRLGKILKRAMVTARHAAEQSGVQMPDAIISGTGLGCIENTEIFLDAMVRRGEEFLQPTHFMQSTHNTISSLVSIDMKCRGYNSTYVHKCISFESALLDAFMQMGQGRISTALVGAYDEMTPSYHLLLSRIGYWRADGEGVTIKRGEEPFSGETSVSFMLGNEKTAGTMCAVKGVEIMYKPSERALKEALERLGGIADADAVMTGINGNPANNAHYRQAAEALFPGKPLLGYKHIFGESYTASALGAYVSAVCLQKGVIPAHMLIGGAPEKVHKILLYNKCDGGSHSLVMLEKA